MDRWLALQDWNWMGMALALALGLLVGMERGWVQRNATPGSRFAGIRTFGLLGLAGGVAGALLSLNEAAALILLAATALLVLAGYLRATRRDASVSGTASLAALLVLVSGFLAGQGQHLPASAVAVGMMMLLAMRRQLHRAVAWLSEEEVTAIARFAMIAMVILPLLPNRAYGPYDAWNPQSLWLVVVLVSGFSLAGYLAARILGPTRGVLATAAAGSMVSSTAVTASLATRLRDLSGEDEAGADTIHAGVAVASCVMLLRVATLAGVLAPFALPTFARLALPGLVVSAVSVVWFLVLARRHGQAAQFDMTLKNPFALFPALLMMGLVMVMAVVARWVLARYGDAGVATVLAISGSVDVDSAVITMGNLPAGTLSPDVAGMVLMAPVVLNTLFKAGIALSLAGWTRGWKPASPLVLTALALIGSAALAWIG